MSVFWTVGLLGGLSVLDEAQSGVRMLMGLYLMLALVALSIILTVFAGNDIANRVHLRRITTSRVARR
ncbi:hypothetical protein [Arthrobacter sp. Br18]|uniref:hypothetical protein n=1 Tax=Arthrobacter sp. Br18 TaxID=1312954 RepID=UPI00138AB851|nr:hypothetical protein [Arthrobacter sp. Br18]